MGIAVNLDTPAEVRDAWALVYEHAVPDDEENEPADRDEFEDALRKVHRFFYPGSIVAPGMTD